MKKILFYALISLLPGTTFAGNQNDGNQKGPVSEYIKTRVMPAVSAQRRAFDVFLSATEKNELASVREQLGQLRESRKAAMAARQKDAGNNNWTANSDAWHENHLKMKELREQVQHIAGNHKDQLDKIFNALAPQKEQWKSDIAKIASSKTTVEESSETSLSASNNFFKGGMNRGFKMWSCTGFLLLDASKNITSDNARETNTGNNLSAITINLFPNPATNQFSLNLSGIPFENKLIVTDMTGRVVLEKENVLPSDAISCNDFNNGIYFVRLSAGEMAANEKLIVSH